MCEKIAELQYSTTQKQHNTAVAVRLRLFSGEVAVD